MVKVVEMANINADEESLTTSLKDETQNSIKAQKEKLVGITIYVDKKGAYSNKLKQEISKIAPKGTKINVAEKKFTTSFPKEQEGTHTQIFLEVEKKQGK